MTKYQKNDTSDARANLRKTRRKLLLDAAKRMDKKANHYRKEAERFRKVASTIQQLKQGE